MPVKILVVDDEPDLELLIRQKFRQKIRDREYEFAFAGNGTAALQVLAQDPDIDLVLTDINMPEMDGLTLLTKLGEHKALRKAVIVSAYGDMQNIRTAMNRGAFDFITKPIDFQDLEITIQKTLQELTMLKQAVVTREQLVALHKELNIASSIQQSILPRKFPPFPEQNAFEIYAEMIPAREVGGDFYDFFLIDDKHLGFVIGDVSGKGVPAAIFMAVSRTLLRAVALRGVPPAECLQHVNGMLCQDNVRSMFVTIFYGTLTLDTGEIEFCNGGHNLPYRVGSDSALTPLPKVGGLALGVMEAAKYEAGRIALQAGETLFLYTDGITEAMDGSYEEYTEERLQAYLRQMSQATPTEMIRGTISAVKAFAAGAPQADDITALAVKYRPAH